MFGLGAPELILILVIALIIFGPNKLPQIGASFGKGIRDFKSAMRDIEEAPARVLADPAPKAVAGSVPANGGKTAAEPEGPVS